MKIARAILYFFAVNNVLSLNFYQENYVDRSIQKFLRSIVRQNVIIRVQKCDIYSERMLDLVAQSVITTWPTEIFVLGSKIRPWNMASSRTLLIYIYPWNDDITYAELNVTVEDVDSISYAKYRPKLLLIMSSNERTLSAQRQLEYLWELKFLDVIILEVSLRSKYSEPVFVAVHRYNGFRKSYTRLTAYDDSIDWYPKSRNIYGDKFKIKFEEIWSPYGSLEPGSGTVGGLAKAFSDTLSIALNGTVVHTNFLDESNMIYRAEGLVDENAHHSVAVGTDRFCLLIPILPAEVPFDFWPIIVTILIGISLSGIVWCASTILRVSERARNPLNTICLILGISPFYAPRTFVEKMLFVATVMTAAEYTAMFQAELFELAIELSAENRVSSFQELFATGLQVVVSKVVYDELAASEQIPSELMRRFTSVGERETISVNTSRAYFTSETDAKVLETKVLGRKGERLFKVSDLCILAHYRVHTIPFKSAFKNEINRALLMTMEYGFTKKHADDFWKDIGTRNESEIILNHSMYVAYLVIFMGYAISLLAFARELIASRVSKRQHPTFCVKCPRIVTR
ncbi:unnamed protein product [Lasius platythorax]|uniref:Ionotropic receptor n=2 Tax=Lasius platythorax TaxID=488582 RepID=A0AAV2NC96_9HYME